MTTVESSVSVFIDTLTKAVTVILETASSVVDVTETGDNKDTLNDDTLVSVDDAISTYIGDGV